MTTTPTAIPSEKRERFVRIAEARTSRAIKSIRLIKNLNNKYLYEYEADEINLILAALQNEVDELTRNFNKKSVKNTEFRINPHDLKVAV
jgi:uncharacterized protein Yka (UPF0111/DUF47 family)